MALRRGQGPKPAHSKPRPDKPTPSPVVAKTHEQRARLETLSIQKGFEAEAKQQRRQQQQEFLGLIKSQLGDLPGVQIDPNDPEVIKAFLLRQGVIKNAYPVETSLVPKPKEPLAATDVSATIPAHQPETTAAPMLDDDRILTKDGVRYYPLSLAAPLAQVARSTLVHWIKKGAKFNGRPLHLYDSPTAGKLYLTEESIQRLAHRFIKWPSKEPAGRVTLAETDDQTGYIGLTDAARTIGVDHHTMWRWATKGTAPTNKPLDVIKCPAADQLYIREKDLSALKKLVPRSGLHAGRRPHLEPQPG